MIVARMFTPGGEVHQITSPEGGVWTPTYVDLPISLEVEKITAANGRCVLLRIWPHDPSGTVYVTYGELTKEVTFVDDDGAFVDYSEVFFGTYGGVTDEVTTPMSGTATIIGPCRAVATDNTMYRCITKINSWGYINEIPDWGFYGSDNLEISAIAEGVINIGRNAFSSCDLIETMHLPSTICNIFTYAFSGCSNLREVRIDAVSPPTMGADPFSSCSNLAEIIVPAGCGEVYKSASGWSKYANIIREADEN